MTIFKDIRDSIDYEKVLQDLGFETFPDRNEIWCSCPFVDNHKNGDSKPSFSVNVSDGDRKGLWNCFVCGGGDFAGLMAELHGDTYEVALQKLSETYHNGYMPDLLDEVNRIFAKNEPKLNNKTLYSLPGFIHHEWLDQFTPEAVKHFGLTYDVDRDGVIIPHHWRGVLVGWQIRLFSGKAKYINTPNFPKRNTLFGYDEARHYNSVIVVEGPKTVIKLWGLGIKNVVATFGASVTNEQITTLMGFDQVSTWFDNDEAGRTATNRVVEELAGISDVYIIPFVSGDKADPADLESVTQVRQYIQRRKSYLELVLSSK